MKTNKTYRSLLDKSINSMLSAIEIYNKPNFFYREETFAILAVNSWELLLKAHLLKCNSYNMKCLYRMEFIKKKNGENSTRKKPALNRTGNPVTLGIFEVIYKIEKSVKFSSNLKASIESIVELRDNAIHFHNEKHISKELQELGFACIKNYMGIIKKWNLDINLSNYNFYLMPLAYIDANVEADAIITDEVDKYLNFVKRKVVNSDNTDEDFTIAISIDINFNKSNSFEGLAMKYDPNGIGISINEEDTRKKYPMTYANICQKLKERYELCKLDKDFHKRMKLIKENANLFYFRKLDTSKEKSSGQGFYSTNIWQELDKFYLKKAKKNSLNIAQQSLQLK